MGNSLNRAKVEIDDEFYTQLTDIEKELRHYRKHFRGKTVLCNCDDPFESNFFKYFALNFNRLGLKKLIATCYATSPIAGQQLSLFDVVGSEPEQLNKAYKAVFPKYRKEMKGLPWGLYYNENGNRTDLDPKALEADVSRLMADEDVTKKAGVYEYLLTGKERCLSIRAFDERMKRASYERQGGVCPYCKQHFELSEMHADHIIPWSKGGTTTADNCQMLCRDCNLKKSDD